MPKGFLTSREREALREQTNFEIRRMMLGITANPISLLEVVGGGAKHFRTNFLRELRGHAVNEEIADGVFKFFCEQVVKKYGNTPVNQLLDSLEVSSLPTADDIEKAWVHEVNSSEEGRRGFYQDADPRHKVVIH